MANPECWSRSLGTRRGARIRVYEREPGGMLYASAWLPGGGESRRSLGHRDRERAVREGAALLKARSRIEAQGAFPGAPLTLADLFARYGREARTLPDGSLKTDAYLRHITATGQALAKFFGPDCVVEDLRPDRIHAYVVWRRNGGLTGKPVGGNTIQRDLGMFKAVLNWARQRYDGQHPLLTGHVMQNFRIPGEKDPKRPVLDSDTIASLLAVAPDVHPFLRPLIVMAWRSGRRLSSILALRWDDIDFAAGTICWRAEHDKIRQTWLVPVHPHVLAELTAFRARVPGIGSALVFPHPRAKGGMVRPVTRHLAAYWLKEAFRRGQLVKPVGSLWHTFRRVWATERKDLPLRDVAAAGGWRDTTTLLRYQQPDASTLRAVVEHDGSTRTAPPHSPSYSLTRRR